MPNNTYGDLFPVELERDLAITLPAKAIYMILGRMLREDDSQQLSARVLAERTKEGMSTLHTKLSELEKHGYLERHKHLVQRAPGIKPHLEWDYVLTTPSGGEYTEGGPYGPGSPKRDLALAQ